MDLKPRSILNLCLDFNNIRYFTLLYINLNLLHRCLHGCCFFIYITGSLYFPPNLLSMLILILNFILCKLWFQPTLSKGVVQWLQKSMFESLYKSSSCRRSLMFQTVSYVGSSSQSYWRLMSSVGKDKGIRKKICDDWTTPFSVILGFPRLWSQYMYI